MHKQWEWLVNSWEILVENIGMLLRGSLDISKGPQVLLYVTEDQNYLSEVMSIQILQLSKLQTVVALSMIEAEYMTATQVCKETIWIQRLMEELEHKHKKISMYCDNQSVFYIVRNPSFDSRTKHISVQYHFMREVVGEGSVDMQKIHTIDNLEDAMTKNILDLVSTCHTHAFICNLNPLIHVPRAECLNMYIDKFQDDRSAPKTNK
ncbi:hypothetical protein CR513_50955, partial [Mucuna pruriens]